MRSQVEFWAYQLRRSDFPSEYPHLEFGPLRTFTIGRGIDDELWRASGSAEEERPDAVPRAMSHAMKIGYARVSTGRQNPDSQRDALETAGCEEVFLDVVSGAAEELPQRDLALSHLREGDTLVVRRLPRLGRSLKDLLEVLERVEGWPAGLLRTTRPSSGRVDILSRLAGGESPRIC